MVGSLPCCACAASGHAAAPPSSVARNFQMGAGIRTGKAQNEQMFSGV